MGDVIAQSKPSRRVRVTNPLITRAIELAHDLAGNSAAGAGGNWGVWTVLGVLLMAYKAGQIVSLARHVEAWGAAAQADRGTA
jgi:hypothetical protein